MAPVTRNGSQAAASASTTNTTTISMVNFAETEFTRVKILRHKTVTRQVVETRLRLCVATGANIETVVTKETVEKIFSIRTIKKSDIQPAE